MIRLATRFATGLATRFPIPSPKRDATRGPITEVNSLHTPLHIYFVNRASLFISFLLYYLMQYEVNIRQIFSMWATILYFHFLGQ